MARLWWRWDGARREPRPRLVDGPRDPAAGRVANRCRPSLGQRRGSRPADRRGSRARSDWRCVVRYRYGARTENSCPRTGRGSLAGERRAVSHVGRVTAAAGVDVLAGWAGRLFEPAVARLYRHVAGRPAGFAEAEAGDSPR